LNTISSYLNYFCDVLLGEVEKEKKKKKDTAKKEKEKDAKWTKRRENCRNVRFKFLQCYKYQGALNIPALANNGILKPTRTSDNNMVPLTTFEDEPYDDCHSRLIQYG